MKEKDIQDFADNYLKKVSESLRTLPNDAYINVLNFWHKKPSRLRFNTNDDTKWYNTYADVIMALSEVLNDC